MNGSWIDSLIGRVIDKKLPQLAYSSSTYTEFLASLHHLHNKTIEISLKGSQLLYLRGHNGNTALHYAAMAGKSSTVGLLLNHSRNYGDGKAYAIRNNNGEMAIHLATSTGQLNVMRLLIDASIDSLYLGGRNGYSPLHYAIENKRIDAIKLLLQLAIERTGHLYATDDEGRSAIHFAAGMGYIDAIKIFLEEQPQLLKLTDAGGKWPLHYAVKERRKEAVEFLTTCNHSVCRNWWEQRDRMGRLPSHIAAEVGLEDILFYLLKINRSTVTMGRSGQEAIHYAIIGNHTKLLQNMLHRYPETMRHSRHEGFWKWMDNWGSGRRLSLNSVKCENPMNRKFDPYWRPRWSTSTTPYHLAVMYNRHEILSIMLEYRARALENAIGYLTLAELYDPSDHDERMETPLHIAASMGDRESVEMLVENNGRTEEDDLEYATPLERAIHCDRGTVSAYLVHITAYPLHHAVRFDNAKVVEYLTKVNIPRTWDEKNQEEQLTPLQMAVQRSNSDVVRRLLNMGARPEKRYGDGDTCLHVALRKNNTDIIELLLEHAKKENSPMLKIANNNCETAMEMLSKINKN